MIAIEPLYIARNRHNNELYGWFVTPNSIVLLYCWKDNKWQPIENKIDWNIEDFQYTLSVASVLQLNDVPIEDYHQEGIFENYLEEWPEIEE